MSYEKPYSLELRIAVPRGVVWRAVTDPAEIRRWFGWDYEGLDQEIDFIFREHARALPPDSIEMPGMNERLELEEDTDGTILRVARFDGETTAEWDGVHDDIEEGWRAFLQQLKLYLEEHRGEDRRTIHLSGVVVPAAAAATLDGDEVDTGRFHRYVRTGHGLAALLVKKPIDSRAPADASLTLTTYGLDPGALERVRAQWEASWMELRIE